MKSPHEEKLVTIGERLRAARLAANMTVREVASVIGCDHSQIVKYENGQTVPSIDRLYTLKSLYGITWAWLLPE